MSSSKDTCNMAEIRKALESVRNWCLNRLGNSSYQVDVEGLLSVVNAALAAPPRNCDVGTPEEQIERWEEFCIAHHEYWKPSVSLTAIQRCNCPCQQGNSCNYFIWAQMPYQEGDQ